MKPSFIRAFSALLVFFTGALAVTASGEVDAESVIIVVNRNDPDSLSIGRYYAEQRSIPEANMIALDAPTEETISLQDYVDRIHNPLLNELLLREWIDGLKATERDDYGRERLALAIHRISYLVTVHGIPLRFTNDPERIVRDDTKFPMQFQHNRAAVDSELALMTAPAWTGMTGFVPNPYFQKKSIADADAHRVIKVSRLDGPESGDVIRLIDRTLEAERSGLMGRAYIDSGGPHKKGDLWFEAARELAETAYFETDFEGTKQPMGFAQRLDAPAIYMGWYRRNAYGPWKWPKWSVPPGAIGFHLHSFSASTVRSTDKAWLGSLVRQGYCATFGNVYEPYLEFTHRPQIVLEHLLSGHNFGDAVIRAVPTLSWQTMAIGDPLYRPFKVGLSAQLVQSKGGPYSAYIGLRLIQQILDREGLNAAIREARSRFSVDPSLPLAYRLSQLFERAGQTVEAGAVLKFVRFLNVFSVDEMVLAGQIADRLHKYGESDLAADLYVKLLEQRNLPKDLRYALLQAGAKLLGESGRSSLASRWELEAQGMRAAESSDGRVSPPK